MFYIIVEYFHEADDVIYATNSRAAALEEYERLRAANYLPHRHYYILEPTA